MEQLWQKRWDNQHVTEADGECIKEISNERLVNWDERWKNVIGDLAFHFVTASAVKMCL